MAEKAKDEAGTDSRGEDNARAASSDGEGVGLVAAAVGSGVDKVTAARSDEEGADLAAATYRAEDEPEVTKSDEGEDELASWTITRGEDEATTKFLAPAS